MVPGCLDARAGFVLRGRTSGTKSSQNLSLPKSQFLSGLSFTPQERVARRIRANGALKHRRVELRVVLIRVRGHAVERAEFFQVGSFRFHRSDKIGLATLKVDDN